MAAIRRDGHGLEIMEARIGERREGYGNGRGEYEL
jgi:hypothetical protein